MHWLSMSVTMSATTSIARRPAPSTTLNPAFDFGLGAASSSRNTSTGDSTRGSLRGS